MYSFPVKVGQRITGIEFAPVRSPGGGADWFDPIGEDLCVWAAYAAKGASSFAASLIDLSGNGHNASSLGVDPDWNGIDGWQFDGASEHLATGFVPSNDATQSVLIQFSDSVFNADDCLFGQYEAATRGFYVYNKENGSDNVKYANGGETTPAPALVAGNLGVAGLQGYRNGSADGGGIAVWGGAAINACYIGGLNNAGVPGDFAAVYIQAVVIYDCTLLPAQMARIAAAMAAL